MKRFWHNLNVFKMTEQSCKNVYSRMQRFADITKNLIMLGNIRRAKRCLHIAEQIWMKGSNTEKNAIANVFVFSVSSFMEMHHCNIKKLFPAALQTEYFKQVNTSCV